LLGLLLLLSGLIMFTLCGLGALTFGRRQQVCIGTGILALPFAVVKGGTVFTPIGLLLIAGEARDFSLATSTHRGKACSI
jgi:hypothetical protein